MTACNDLDGHDPAVVARVKAEVERLCEVMHDAYEKAAVGAGWQTQQASRKPWAEVPEANKVTMRAAVLALLVDLNNRGLIHLNVRDQV